MQIRIRNRCTEQIVTCIGEVTRRGNCFGLQIPTKYWLSFVTLILNLDHPKMEKIINMLNWLDQGNT